MSRKNRAERRTVKADVRFGSELVTRLVNRMMLDGKKSTAERIVYSAFELIQTKTGEDPLKQFKDAIENIKPAVEVRSRRVGGATYQVPVDVRPVRQLTLSLRWLVKAFTCTYRKRHGKSSGWRNPRCDCWKRWRI